MPDFRAGEWEQQRAAERRGVSLDEYRAQRAQMELERDERRRRRAERAESNADFRHRLAEQRRRMLYPGDGTALAPDMTLLGSYVDTLYVSLQGEVDPGVLVSLAGAQEAAQREREPQPSDMTWRGESVQVHGRGQQFWPLRCETPDWNLLLGADYGPPAYVQFRAQFLYERGPEQAWDEFRVWAVANVFSVLQGAAVSRIDLAADVAGLDLSELEVAHFVGAPRRRERLAGVEEEATGRLIFYGPKTFTVYLGSRSGRVMGRLYDKLAEIRVSGKEWMLHYWSGWDGETGVARVECQVRLEFLEDMGVRAPDDVLPAVGDIWREVWGAKPAPCRADGFAVVPGWCTYRIPQGDDSNRSRWPVADWWEALARSGFIERRQGLVSGAREKIQGAEARALVPALVGYMASVAYRSGYRPETPDEVASQVLTRNRLLISEVMAEKGTDWAEVYREKVAKLGKG